MKKDKEIRKFPRKLKFNKMQRGSLHLINYSSSGLSKGSFGLKTLSAGFLKWKTLIECQKNLKRILKKKKNKINIWFNSFLDWPVSRKPKGTRMGKGKGKVNFDDWVCRVPAGKVLIEISFTSESLARNALFLSSKVLPIPCTFVKKT